MDAHSEATVVDKNVWNDIVSSADGHIFQTFHWADVLQELGIQTIPFMLKDKAVLMAQKLPVFTARRLRLKYHILQVLRGPVFRTGTFNRSAFEEILSRLVRYAQTEKALAIDLFPNVPASDAQSGEYLLAQGFKPLYDIGAFHTQTYVLDCEQSDEDLLKRMEKRTRWAVRKAQKLGVKVQDGNDDRLLDSFFGVYSSTNRYQSASEEVTLKS